MGAGVAAGVAVRVHAAGRAGGREGPERGAATWDCWAGAAAVAGDVAEAGSAAVCCRP